MHYYKILHVDDNHAGQTFAHNTSCVAEIYGNIALVYILAINSTAILWNLDACLGLQQYLASYPGWVRG